MTQSRAGLWARFKKTFVGNKAFYLMVMAVAGPIIVQNAITNFVSLLDNIMIGRVGTEQMSGASIVNQLLFVYNITLFGATSGAGIFSAQYYGQGNAEGLRETIRFKYWIVTFVTIVGSAILILGGRGLIGMFLTGEGDPASTAATLNYGRQYLLVMLIGLIPFMITQVYSSSLRDCGKTTLPMVAGIIAILVNLVFNYILIYGKFGAPALGVIGAAIATVISRFVEAGIIVIVTHRRARKTDELCYLWARGLYKTLKVPGDMACKIIIKGLPLMFNEMLWSVGMTFISQSYSVLGYRVVAAQNISGTLSNLFNTVYLALGDSVAIIVGQRLGAGRMDEARDYDNKMLAFAVGVTLIMAVLLMFAAPFFPLIYNTDAGTQALATKLIFINSCFMPVGAFLHSAYFTLRSGGKTLITFLFDNVFMWVASVPAAWCLSRYSGLSILPVYALVQSVDILKCIFGGILVKKGLWMNNLVG